MQSALTLVVPPVQCGGPCRRQSPSRGHATAHGGHGSRANTEPVSIAALASSSLAGSAVAAAASASASRTAPTDNM